MLMAICHIPVPGSAQVCLLWPGRRPGLRLFSTQVKTCSEASHRPGHSNRIWALFDNSALRFPSLVLSEVKCIKRRIMSVSIRRIMMPALTNVLSTEYVLGLLWYSITAKHKIVTAAWCCTDMVGWCRQLITHIIDQQLHKRLPPPSLYYHWH